MRTMRVWGQSDSWEELCHDQSDFEFDSLEFLRVGSFSFFIATTIYCFKLDTTSEALLLIARLILPCKVSCLQPVSEMCKYSEAGRKTVERSKIGKIHK